MHIAAAAAHPASRPSGRTPLFQPIPLQLPLAETLPAEALDMFIDTQHLQAFCCSSFQWRWKQQVQQVSQQQHDSIVDTISTTESEERLRQSIRTEVEQVGGWALPPIRLL